MKIVRRIAALLLAAALSAALLCPAALADETSGTPEKAAPEITLSQTSAVMAAGDTLQLTARCQRRPGRHLAEPDHRRGVRGRNRPGDGSLRGPGGHPCHRR